MTPNRDVRLNARILALTDMGMSLGEALSVAIDEANRQALRAREAGAQVVQIARVLGVPTATASYRITVASIRRDWRRDRGRLCEAERTIMSRTHLTRTREAVDKADRKANIRERATLENEDRERALYERLRLKFEPNRSRDKQPSLTD